MKSLLVLALIFICSCSRLKLAVDGNELHSAKIISHGSYKEIQGAGNVLRKVSEVTLMITFRQTGKQDTTQDLMAFSVGGKEKSTLISRASIRLEPDGYLVGIARASDTEEPGQYIRAKEKIPAGDFHNAALVIDYSKNEMHLYLDGKPIETTGTVAFKAPMTDDTPSINVSLGAEDNGSTFHFQGELKQPRIWRKKLAAEEILTIVQN